MKIYMGLSGNFDELPAERRQHILSACIDEFAERGYRGASTERMAQAAGISKGLLFYHFKNKKNLYLYLLDHTVKVMRERLEKMEPDKTSDFFEWIVRRGLMKRRLGWEEPKLYRLLLDAYLHTSPDIKQDMLKRFAGLFQDAREQLYQEMDTSIFKEGVDPKMAVEMILLVTEGLYNRKLPALQQMSPEEVLDALQKMQDEIIAYIELLKKGICK